MPTNLGRTDASAMPKAAAHPAANAGPAANGEVKWVRQFPARLKHTMLWMKQFLHGRK